MEIKKEASENKTEVGLPSVDTPATVHPAAPQFPGFEHARKPMFDVFLGPDGLRAGWLLLLFAGLLAVFAVVFGTLVSTILQDLLHLKLAAGTALGTAAGEGELVLSLFASLTVLAFLERRHVRDFYLSGTRLLPHFASGLLVGFLALSALVVILAAGGWLHFGPVALSGTAILRHGASWGLAFLLVGFAEEGCFRCYVQFTLTRSMNFWWAVAVVGAMCLSVMLWTKGHGGWGVYVFALAGVAPCFYLHVREKAGNRFWQAAWAGSAGFGFIHTFNSGENWIGILAASMIGFVFCVSVWLTGSAWWAIGCHSAWDWAETYFYGTADSGLVARGHLLTTSTSGASLWSGGTDGPEGSLLVLPVVLLLLLILFLQYGRNRGHEQPQSNPSIAE